MQTPMPTFHKAAEIASSALMQAEANETWDMGTSQHPDPVCISVRPRTKSRPCQCMDASALLTRHAHNRDYKKVGSSPGMRMQQACASPHRPLLHCTLKLRWMAAKTPRKAQCLCPAHSPGMYARMHCPARHAASGSIHPVRTLRPALCART